MLRRGDLKRCNGDRQRDPRCYLSFGDVAGEEAEQREIGRVLVGEIVLVFPGEAASRSLDRVERPMLGRNLMGRDLKRYSKDRSRFALRGRVWL